MGEDADYIRNEAFVSWAEQTEHVQYAGERPRGESSSAKAEQIDLVTFLKDIH